jgi:hypothetical protein
LLSRPYAYAPSAYTCIAVHVHNKHTHTHTRAHTKLLHAAENVLKNMYLRDLELSKYEVQQYPELVKVDVPIIRYMDELCKAMGLRHCLDLESEIKSNEIMSPDKKAVIAQCLQQIAGLSVGELTIKGEVTRLELKGFKGQIDKALSFFGLLKIKTDETKTIKIRRVQLEVAEGTTMTASAINDVLKDRDIAAGDDRFVGLKTALPKGSTATVTANSDANSFTVKWPGRKYTSIYTYNLAWREQQGLTMKDFIENRNLN